MVPSPTGVPWLSWEEVISVNRPLNVADRICCVIIQWVWTTSSVRVVRRVEMAPKMRFYGNRIVRSITRPQRCSNITGSSACWYVTQPPRLLYLPSAVQWKDLSVKESSKTVQGSSLFHPSNMIEKMKKLIVYQMFLTKPWWMPLQWNVSEADKLDDSTLFALHTKRNHSCWQKKRKKNKK